MTTTAYAGQAWFCDIIRDDDPHASNPTAVLTIMAEDIAEDARKKGLGKGAHLELWTSNLGGRAVKGLFMGDTSALAEEGWELITRLF